MEPLTQRLDEARAAVERRTAVEPVIGVVLGSGLGAFADSLLDATRIPYAEIPHQPAPRVVGHAGQLCVGTAGGVPVACLQGRVHAYEGHSPDAVVFGARLLARLGCRAVLLTNAAGGIRAGLGPGTLMLITDHLNLSGWNPLVGPNVDELGPRFPDLSRAYDPRLLAAAERVAAEQGVTLARGVYASLLGPSYETPAEIRMLRQLGADAVGMSTVPEVIALRHLDVAVGALSCITNLAAGIGDAPLAHAEVEAVARSARDRVVTLLGAWIAAAASEVP